MSLLVKRGQSVHRPKLKCKVTGCFSYELSVGLCGKHYQQWRFTTEERCGICGCRGVCEHRNPGIFAAAKGAAA